MEIAKKLDEDFLFYLGFIQKGVDKFKKNQTEYEKCQAWLRKLCNEVYRTAEKKRDRNIFLSHLVLCIAEGKLTEHFMKEIPTELPDAVELFGPQLPVTKEPDWMNEIVTQEEDDKRDTTDARTYIATKALPDGQGALGYIAVSLDEELPDVKTVGFDRHMEQKFEEMVPPLTEMERILINRQVPEERQKVLDYYKMISNNVANEIDGKIPMGSNPLTLKIINQLIETLKQKNEYVTYEAMPAEERTMELLYLLDSRLQERINYIQRREDFLDNIEQEQLHPAFFETSLLPEDIHKEERESRASKMWTQAINAGPSKKLIREIGGKYPPFVIKKFLELLANTKEKIAIRVQRRHENVFSQLKKELRKEGEKGRRKYEKTKITHDEIVEITQAVKAADKRAYESYQRREECLSGHRKERDELYEQVRNAMNETQEHVEEEAAFGRYLSEQINSVTAQTEIFQHVNEETILKIEDDNIAIMKNIQRLSKVIKQHENRINNMKQILAKTSTTSGTEFMFI